MFAVVGAEVAVHQFRAQRQVAHGAESADAQDDAVEEHQGVPLGPFQRFEDVVLPGRVTVMLARSSTLSMVSAVSPRSSSAGSGKK